MSSMTLSQRIEVEQGKRKPADVTELTLDHCKSSKVEGLSDDFVNLEFLSLSNVGLTSLDGLPNLPNLKSLELSNNSINGGLDLLEKCPNLRRLDLSYNKIDSVETLLPLAKLSSLVNLHLSNCAVASIEDYRKLVFAALPTLKSLDGSNEDGESVEDNIPNGAEANGDEEEEEDSDDEEEEEYGIEALQRSGELEDDDDEEDYAPGEDEEAELDEYDDDIDDEEDDVDEDDTGANLSGAGVEGPRRPASKRRLEADVGNGEAEDAPVAKQQIVAENNEEAVAD